jgi:hypothetical protein
VDSPTLGEPVPLAVTDQPPPEDIPSIQAIRLGDSQAAAFAEHVSSYIHLGAKLIGKVERLAVP